MIGRSRGAGRARFVRRGLELALVIAPAALFTVHVSSCSLIGLGTGAVVDSQRKDKSSRAILKIHEGSSLTLLLKDGRSLHGHFDGRRDMDAEAYARLWKAWRDTSRAVVTLPSPGDSVRLMLKDGSIRSGWLAAYQIDGIEVASAGGTRLAAIDSVHQLADRSGQTFSQEFLSDVTRGAKVPLGTLIRLRMPHGASSRRIVEPVGELAPADNEILEIPLHAVELVNGPAPTGGKIIGLVVGLTVDVIIVAAAASYDSDCGGSTISLNY